MKKPEAPQDTNRMPDPTPETHDAADPPLRTDLERQPPADLRDRIALLEQQLTLAQARLQATEHDRERWKLCAEANDKLHNAAVAELRKLKGDRDES